MKINYFLILFIFSLSACNSVDLAQELAGTDTIEFIFYAQKNTPADTFRLKDKAYLKELINTFGKQDLPHYKCGYQGKLKFLRTRVKVELMEAEFNLSKDCAHLSFIYQGKIYTRSISSEGVEFIKLAKKYKPVVDGFDLSLK